MEEEEEEEVEDGQRTFELEKGTGKRCWEDGVAGKGNLLNCVAIW